MQISGEMDRYDFSAEYVLFAKVFKGLKKTVKFMFHVMIVVMSHLLNAELLVFLEQCLFLKAILLFQIDKRYFDLFVRIRRGHGRLRLTDIGFTHCSV